MQRTARRVSLIMGLMFACSAMAGVDLQNFQINSSVPDPDPVLPVSSSFAPPVSDLPTHDPNVGTLVGQASTDGGAATYQVPIVVPPGRAGMQPSISLNYNSRSGNGIAGIGWTISGLSSIHRCPQTPEQDNPTAAAYKPAVTYASSDRLCLDGQRLVPFSGAYGVSGTEYRTEVDSYARIFQVGGTGLADNTACFRVEQKDGRIFHYGGVIAGTAPSLTCTITASVNSRALPNSTTPLSWLVEKIEDRVGNNQLYSYLNVAGSSGEVLLQKVTYTGFGAAAGDRVVTFNYEPRSSASSDVGDIASNYLAGALTLQTQALKCITTTVGAVKATDLCDPTRYVRTYTPSYAATAYNGSATHSSRLIMKSLQECATNATGTACHPATHFSFNDGPLDYPLTSLSALALPATTTSVSPYQLYTIGDLDGDGTREVAASFDNRSFLVQLTADRAAHGATELTGTPFCVLPKCYADIDGSGRSSLIQTPASSAVAQVMSFGAWNFSLFSRGQVATSNPFFTVASNIQFNYSSTGQGSGPVYTADFNGDGKMDVAVVGPSASCGSDAFGTKKGVFVWLNAMAGTLTAGQTASFAPTQGTVAAPLPLLCIPRTVSSGHYDEPAIEHIADFDGNGLPDIYLVYAGTGTQLGSFAGIALTQGSGSTLSSTIKSCTQIGLVSDGTNTDDECNWNQNYVTHWMDVNGDGLEDFVIARAAQQTWQVRLNKGNGTLGSVIIPSGSDSEGLITYSVSGSVQGFRYASKLPLMDVDGDGKPDILVPSKTQGLNGFALKMCTLTKVLPSATPGEGCHGVNGAYSASSSPSPDAGETCPAYSCPENPDGTVTLPPNSGEVGYNFQWNGLPAFGSYGGALAHGIPSDNSAYHLAMLKFVQTGSSSFRLDLIETPLVSRMGDSIGHTDDVFGDGLQDLVTSIGCSNITVSNGLPPGDPLAWWYPACSVVNNPTYGPTELPDGALTSQFASSVALYGSINQGVASPGGSPSVAVFPSGNNPPPPALRQATPAPALLADHIYLPGLLNAVINGVGDTANWGYVPLSRPSSQNGLDFYTVPSGNGYADSRHYYFESSMPVVYGLLQASGTGALSAARSANYYYDSAIYNHGGRGFQGFRAITTENGNYVRTTTTYHQKFPLAGKVASVDTGVADSSTSTFVVKPVQSEVNAWRCTRAVRTLLCPGDSPTVPPVPGTIYRPFLDNQSVKTFDLATGALSSHVDTVNAATPNAATSGWDTTACDTGTACFGNLNSQVVTLVDDASGGAFVSSHTTTSTNTYDLISSGSWWIDKLAGSTATSAIVYAAGHALPSGVTVSAQTVSTGYTWNTDRTANTKTVQSGALNQQSTTTWTYPPTSYGLPKQVSVNAPDLNSTPALSPTRTVNYTYTPDGYFVLTTNPGLGQTTTTEVAASDGQVIRSTDPNGVQQVVKYDAFGRAVQIDHLDSSIGHAAFESSVLTAYTSCLNSSGQVGHCTISEVGEDAYETNAAYRVTTVHEGYPTQVAWYDQLGRSIKQAERGFNGTFIATLTDYTISGTVDKQSTPYFVGFTAPYFTGWTYDALNRPTQKDSDQDLTGTDLVTNYTYSGRTTNITVHDSSIALVAGACPTSPATNLCLSMSRSTNVLGQLMQTSEAPGGIAQNTNYWTEPQGHVAAIKDPESNITTATYNALGQRIASNDPDQHAWTFTYDAFGESLTQTDARGVVTTVNARDALGRTTEQQAVPPATVPTGLANETVVDRWVFDAVSGVGELGQQKRLRGPNRTTPGSNPEVWREDYTYEALTARPSTITTTISEGTPQTLTSGQHYDSDGRPDTHTYPSATGANRLVVRTSYTPYGQRSQLSNDATSTVYWTATAANEWDQVTGETFLGGFTGTHQDYHSTPQAYQLNWSGSGLSDRFVYGYDSFENLKSQARNAVGATNSETYTYDPLQRLIKAARTTGAPVMYDYTTSGNLKYKSDYSTTAANAYAYGGAGSGCGPHAASSVSRAAGGTTTYTCDANGNVIGGSAITATYDAGNHPRTLTRTQTVPDVPACHHTDTIFCDGFEIVTTTTTTGNTTWTYTTTGGRSTELSSAGLRFFGPSGYELVGGVSKHELGPVVISRTGGTESVSIVLKDRLGSTLDTIDGTIINRRSYDAFGAVRNGDMSNRTNGTLNLADTIHGFTDHTHSDDVALIHMGGRVYDYTLGRFLSVDPLISNPANSQSLNPYTYLGNNPLSGTDPTGYACQEDSNGQVTSACLKSNDGINEITSADGKTLGTVIVASKGDHISVDHLHNGGSLNSTFTGKTGDISRVLNGPPSDIGAISKLTNSTLEGSAASYPMAPDQAFSSVDYMAERAQAQVIADAYATRQWNFAHEGIEGVPVIGVEALGQAAYGAYSDIKRNGGVSAATIGGVVITAAAAGLHLPGAGVLRKGAGAAAEDLIADVQTLRGPTTVIGKLKDLEALSAGEQTLLGRLTPNLGSPQANWARNSGVLRQEMARGVPIRDASVDARGKLINNTGFLRAERNLLQSRGWTYSETTASWNPPAQP